MRNPGNEVDLETLSRKLLSKHLYVSEADVVNENSPAFLCASYVSSSKLSYFVFTGMR